MTTAVSQIPFLDRTRDRNREVRGERPLGVQAEGIFLRMLSVERKRCERTGHPFALMLLNLEKADIARRTIKKVGNALAFATRDTDITGWYRSPSILGVMFTTLGATDRETLHSVLFERTYKILRQVMDSMEIHKLQVTFHFYPEDKTNGDGGGESDRVLYPDIQKTETSTKLLGYTKRAIDVSGALVGLVITSPVFIATSVLIKLTSPGPVFFKQKRVGQFGREFVFLKFRSMVVNNDASIHQNYVRDLIAGNNGNPDGTFKIKNDPRVTRIGRFLRRSSLDELPQLINVLKGEMSLVGPRPPIRYETESYKVWHQRRIQEVKPGITGLWQVTGRSRTTFDEMVRLDLQYIENQSLWLDLKIILKTGRAVLSGDGAY
jgi:exopolysaccharide biosynthesis polyprenyl glycosylphosphotransferase